MVRAVSADETGREAAHDATIIGEVRAVRRNLAKLAILMTVEEIDALLRAVDERDDLKRRLLSDWEPDFDTSRYRPDGLRYQAGCPRRDTVHDCPLGGCADASPRPSDIPDVPIQSHIDLLDALAKTLSKHAAVPPEGREARETPPTGPEFTGRHHWQCMAPYNPEHRCAEPGCGCPCHHIDYANTPA
jgi:hypothetical protein